MIRKALAFVFLALLLALVGGTGRAQAAGGTYRIQVGGNPILGWSPDSGSIDQTADDKLSATGTLTSVPPQGAIGSADYAIQSGPGVVRAKIDGSFTVPSNLAYGFDPTMQAVSTTELTISGPDTFFVNTTVNLHVDGYINPPVCAGPVQCGGAEVSVSIGPFIRQAVFNTFGQTRDNSLGLSLDPVPGGYHVHGDVTSSVIGMLTNRPTPVTIALNLSGAYGADPSPTTFSDDFGGPAGPYQVSFAPSGPVLNDIPAGYTVSGPSVVDNLWTDPFAPASGNVVVTSCAQLSQLTVVHGNLTIRNLQGCPTIALPNLTRVDGDLIIEGTDVPIELRPDTSVGGAIEAHGNSGDLTIDTGSVGGAIDVSGTGGDLTIDPGTVGGAIDVSGTGGDLTIDDGTVGGAIDVSGTGGDLTIDDNTVGEDIDADDSGGDVTISGNLDADSIDVGDTGGNLTITDNGETVVDAGSGQVGGNLTVETEGDPLTATTADGTTSITLLESEASMHAVLPAGAFDQPVTFTITRTSDAPPVDGTAPDGSPAQIDTLLGYRFQFGIPTLNADAQLTFTVDLSQLDAAARTNLIGAIANGNGTIAVKGDAPDATFHAFAQCVDPQMPAADGCVAVTLLNAGGEPIGPNEDPAFARFEGVAGHFSTYAVATFTSADHTPPVVTVPADLAVDATSPAGAKVTYAASATDGVDPSPSLVCAPASGSTFPIGTTTVTCTATDAAGNSASAHFDVHVRGASEQLVRLVDKTLAYLDRPALKPALRAQLQAVADALARRPRTACLALDLYTLAVRVAPAQAFSPAEKAELTADAARIKAVIGCG